LANLTPHPRSRLRIEIIDSGSVILFQPLDGRARDWLDDNVESLPWQWLGSALIVDHRLAGDIIEAIQKIWSG
jgi:hypothetical protein